MPWTSEVLSRSWSPFEEDIDTAKKHLPASASGEALATWGMRLRSCKAQRMILNQHNDGRCFVGELMVWRRKQRMVNCVVRSFVGIHGRAMDGSLRSNRLRHPQRMTGTLYMALGALQQIVRASNSISLLTRKPRARAEHCEACR